MMQKSLICHFYKMHGVGNDFILLDHRPGKSGSVLQATPETVCKLCVVHTGIGSDGLMLLENSEIADFKIGFYNADGFPSTMCGNGVRCAVWLAHHLNIAPSICTFEIMNIIYSAEVLGKNKVRVKMQPPKILASDKGLHSLTDENFTNIMWMDTGVPHLVIQTKQALESLDVLKWGRHFRYHQAFQPQGVNVNFVRELKKNHLQLRVYERGVENETLACGTGAVACSLFAAQQFDWPSPVHVHSPGGELVIEFDTDYNEVYLNGNVTLVYEGDINSEYLSGE